MEISQVNLKSVRYPNIILCSVYTDFENYKIVNFHYKYHHPFVHICLDASLLEINT